MSTKNEPIRFAPNVTPAMRIAYAGIQEDCIHYFGPCEKWTKRQRDEFHKDIGKAFRVVMSLENAGVIKETKP